MDETARIRFRAADALDAYMAIAAGVVPRSAPSSEWGGNVTSAAASRNLRDLRQRVSAMTVAWLESICADATTGATSLAREPTVALIAATLQRAIAHFSGPDGDILRDGLTHN